MAYLLLVDKNDAYRTSLAALLADDGGADLTGQATSLGEALRLLEHRPADLVLADVSLADASGLELARRLKAGAGAPLVIILALHAEPAYERAAREAGADAFFSKDQPPEFLVGAVRRLLGRPGAGGGE
jgi:DNA-binding NarL/FixJ family response regulator